MSTLHTLKAPHHSNHRKKRVGRGQGSGLGKTAGRGHKLAQIGLGRDRQTSLYEYFRSRLSCEKHLLSRNLIDENGNSLYFSSVMHALKEQGHAKELFRILIFFFTFGLKRP